MKENVSILKQVEVQSQKGGQVSPILLNISSYMLKAFEAWQR
jgi:hypothetical protein